MYINVKILFNHIKNGNVELTQYYKIGNNNTQHLKIILLYHYKTIVYDYMSTNRVLLLVLLR